MKIKVKFIPLVSIGQLITYLDYIEKFEPSLIPAVFETGIPQAIKEHREEGYISREVAMTLFNLLETKMSESSMNKMLAYACAINTEQLLARHKVEGTLGEVLESICSQLSLYSTDTCFKLKQVGKDYWFYRVRESIDSPLAGRITLLMMVNLVQKLTQTRWEPGKVTSINATREPLRPFSRSHSIQYTYGQAHTGILIPADLMESSLARREVQSSETCFDDLKTFGASLKAVIKPYLSSSIPTLEEVSHSLRISARTLQRRLQSESLSYGEVLHEAIDEQACQALVSTDSTITAISYRLGYSCASHFTRAFKRKFGLTPTEYRKQYRTLTS